MGKITYYLATSLDGYLAREDGSVDWLNPFQSPLGTKFDFEPFGKTVKAAIMGRKTWDISVSFEKTPFNDVPCYVFSRTLVPREEHKYIHVLELNKDAIQTIKRKHSGRIWLVGGAEIASSLIQMGELDEIIQTIVPVSIGSGIRWIKPSNKQTDWKLEEVCKANMDIVQLIYQNKSLV